VSSIDEFESFAMGGARTNGSSRNANVHTAETKQNLSAKINNGKRVPDVKVSQSNDVDDLESIFSMGSRSSSVPKSRTPTTVKAINMMSLNDFRYPDTIFSLIFMADMLLRIMCIINQMKNKGKPEVSPRVPSGSPASAMKPPTMTSFDDLSLIFGGKVFLNLVIPTTVK